jgi:hypothetical protein
MDEFVSAEASSGFAPQRRFDVRLVFSLPSFNSADDACQKTHSKPKSVLMQP